MPIQTEAPSRKSWRDVLPIHPAAELFPPMSSDELRELGADIVKKNGLVAPIALWRRNPNEPLQLLDGRNRLDAIELVTGRTVEIGAPSLMAGDFLACDKVVMLDHTVDPYAYAISANIHRRHLSVEQRQHLFIKAIARAPEKSDRQIAKEIGVDHKTIASARAKGEDVGSIPHVSTRTDTKGRQQPAKKATTSKNPKAPHAAHERRAAQQETKATHAVDKPTPRDDIGATSTSELALQARVCELQNEKRRLQIENFALRSEIKELKLELARRAAAGDGLDIPKACVGAPGLRMGKHR